MNSRTGPDQQKTVQLDRGLFFVNYVSAEDTSAPPRVVVNPEPGDERRIELVLHPDADEAVLWQPNSRLVVRVEAPATLQVQVLPMRPGGSRAANVRIEPIQHGTPPSLGRSAAAYAPSPQFSSPTQFSSSTQLSSPLQGQTASGSSFGFRVLGHVAGIGDVFVGPNDWIAGPATPSRIEGIALEWPDRPAGLDIRYGVQFANAQAGSGKMVPLGTFAGTRGRALPITNVVLEMTGRDDLEFVAEAVFLNAPTLRAVGRRVVLSGPSGREPLVGLRIDTESRTIEEPARTLEPVKAVKQPATSGRVRVFRSRARQDAPT